MRQFLTELPKAELHLHLEGSLAPQTVVDLATRNAIDSFRTVEEVERSLASREPGLLGFLGHYNEALKVLRTRQDFYQATYDLLSALNDNGVVYVELSFDPQAHTSRGIPFDSIIGGIDDGRRAAALAFGVETGLIMAINRERSVDSAMEALDQAASHRDKILAIGLDSGPEEGNPPSKFEAVYGRAREEGYRLTLHCDVDQPSSIRHIWQAIDLLRVERIDHGLDAIGDPALVEELKRRGICLTACPVQRSTDPEPQDLDKIRVLFDAGVCVNLNTDDPAQFDSGYLIHLLHSVQQAGGYSRADMVRFAIDAFEASFLPRSAKDAYIESVQAYAAAHGGSSRPPPPGERAFSLAAEVVRLAARRSLWPGFEPRSIPLAVYDGERTHLFRHPDPPAGFVAVRPAGDAHAYEGRHAAVAANTSADIGGTMTATLLLQGPDANRSLAELAAVALHEAFHVYQRQRHPDWQANEGDLFVYPTSDPQLLALRRLETEALRRALAASAAADSACWARRALALRGERFDRMEPAFAAYERGTELNEGLATYVELRAAGRETVALPAGGFGAAEVRRRAYATGPAWALLLDRFDAGWSASFEADDRQNLDRALRGALGADGGDASNRCAFSDTETAETGRIAGEDAAGVLRRQAERRQAFEARPGWRIVVETADGEPLWPEGFDPLNVERVEGGVLHSRFLRAANDCGQLEAMDDPETDIEALTEAFGPHPLFHGFQRVVIAGLAKPEVRIDGRHVTVRVSGLAASFERASVHHGPRELVVKLEPEE